MIRPKPPKQPADPDLNSLANFLKRIPGIEGHIGVGRFEDQRWRVTFTIDIKHPLAWNVVQELAYVLNYLSIQDRLPTVFMPVSPPPYLNGGPSFLSWTIESKLATFTATTCAEWLEGRLPQPVEDQSKWPNEE